MATTQNKKVKRNALVAASIAGMMAFAGLAITPAVAQADDQCYGVNKCKGTGACGGQGHSCHGQNACKGQGWLSIDADTCLKIEGGSLTPVE